MKTAAIAFILSMFCGAVLTPIVRKFALRFGLLDHALSSRKIHGAPIPRVGGIAIVIAFYAPLVGLTLFQTGIGDLFLGQREHVLGLFAGGLAIALLGLYDDLRGTKARLKFLVQFGVAGLLYHWGFRVGLLANPFGNPIELGWISLPFTLLWIVGVINAMNLIDGLDGLAGGVALVAVIITFVISVQRGEPLMMLFTSALAGSILGFLFYNFNPASIFMGDTGSMFLGFVLATTAIQTNQKASTAVAVLIPGVALGLPLLDTLLALTRRAVRGRPLFQADREHIHHRLIALGLSHRQAVLVLYGFCVLLGVAALMLTYTNSAQSALLLVVMALVAFFFLRSLGYVRFDRIAESAAERKRNKAILAAIRPLGQRLRQFPNAEAMWPSVIEAAAVVGATSVSLWFKKIDDGERFTEPGFSHSVDPNDDAAESLRARFAVPSGRRQECQLELGWTDERREIDRDTEIAIDIFCEYLGGALDGAPAAGVALRRPSAGV